MGTCVPVRRPGGTRVRSGGRRRDVVFPRWRFAGGRGTRSGWGPFHRDSSFRYERGFLNKGVRRHGVYIKGPFPMHEDPLN